MSHMALRFVNEGRGWGTMAVAVVDLARVGKGTALHVLDRDYRPLCGTRGEVGEILSGCDARAEIVLRKPVCVRCRDLLGTIPQPMYTRPRKEQ